MGRFSPDGKRLFLRLTMILTKPQAKAIYRAMLELDNVGMLLEATDGPTRVFEYRSGNVVVDAYAESTETYRNRLHFAIEYGLND